MDTPSNLIRLRVFLTPTILLVLLCYVPYFLFGLYPCKSTGQLLTVAWAVSTIISYAMATTKER
jgi:hypothetical protein